MTNDLFQMEHSPRGAEAAFSLGCANQGGGFSLESGETGRQDVSIGFFQNDTLTLWPFLKPETGANTGMSDFIPTGDTPQDRRAFTFSLAPAETITRTLGLGTDTWEDPRIRFTIATPVAGIPDPGKASSDDMKDSLCPALTAVLRFDNRDGDTLMQGFFTVSDLPGFRFLDDDLSGLSGVRTLGHYGFATPEADGVSSFSDFRIRDAFIRPKPLRTRHQGMAGLLIDVAPGTVREIPLVFGWYKPGIVTLGKNCRYAYTNYFADLSDVYRHALEHGPDWMKQAEAEDATLRDSGLNEDRQFLIAKSIRSYWGSSQLFLDEDNSWRWVLNEGSCNMINTLDLTVDMAFFEADVHPWLLRNVLDRFATEYRYEDTLHLPDQPGESFPGGLSFTHDQGDRNVFTPNGRSHYELENQPGCFSFMTHEELLNWILCAGILHRCEPDPDWLRAQAALLRGGLQSMQHRDHPDPEQRDGLMNLDSDRCGQESEITTYDSLDPSLGQARRNAYMGVKSWAAYLTLAHLLQEAGGKGHVEAIASARHSADLAAATLIAGFDEAEGFIPAILDGEDRSAIIPIIESLIYPAFQGLENDLSESGPYGELIRVLRRHHQTVLTEGRCLFPDGGWKLSGNNDNSWMSKIFIAQWVAEKVLDLPPNPDHDRAHADWWRIGCRAHSVIDQVIAGQAPGQGSTYPRCISNWIWFPDSPTTQSCLFANQHKTR